ncbi:MAG: hypothetical protein QFX35_00035 [Candidatus Verstraetearchaeota archaeon]|nr:hypothetical protein [Candidatus Verstraetearchaeota archaeon]
MDRSILASLTIMAILTVGAYIVGEVKGENIPDEDIQERFQEAIGGWIKFFETNLEWLSWAMLEFMKYAIKTVYFVIGLAGFVMWASGISRYTGKKLMIGAVMMAIVSELLL